MSWNNNSGLTKIGVYNILFLNYVWINQVGIIERRFFVLTNLFRLKILNLCPVYSLTWQLLSNFFRKVNIKRPQDDDVKDVYAFDAKNAGVRKKGGGIGRKQRRKERTGSLELHKIM